MLPVSLILLSYHAVYLFVFLFLDKMTLTLYAVSDGPPSLAVRQCLKALGLTYNHINVDFGLGEHMTDEFEKVNNIKIIQSFLFPS